MGVIYSIHSPGLPALLLPVYAVAGHWGALALVGLLARLALHGGRGELARADGRSSNPEEVSFVLPVGLDDVWLAATSVDLATALTRVDITPASVVPRHARRDIGRIRSVRPIGDRPGAYPFWT